MKKIFAFAFVVSILSGCDKDDEVYSLGNALNVPVQNLVSISSISKPQLEADSLGITVIEVKLHPEADSFAKNIYFTTSKGLFLNGRQADSVRANSNGIATISLLSNDFGTANIRVQSKQIQVDGIVNFTPSLPDDMLMTADNYIGDTLQSFTVTNKLFRNPGRGKVSDPVKVFYSVVPDVPGSPDLVYPPFAFSSGKETAITILNPLRALGRYRVHAKTVAASAPTDTIRRSILLTIQ
ncbi:MAG: hypothetical protein HOP10_00625 [Chitinophagaceae bacterium]|nr:hypothetical protein [Chitinophagaceae bacterium]